jgi:Arc/MetJ-type ribon-helix-helix transcriptional regulator
MRTHVVLPDELIEDIDKLVGKRNRSRFIAQVMEERLRRERLLKAIHEGAGSLDMSRHPEWETPEKVAEWIGELRDTPSIREQGEYALSNRLKRSDRLAQRKTSGRQSVR